MAKRRRSKAPVAKANTKVVMRYDGASNGRRMGSWQAPASGPNKAITGLPTLRNRAHDAVRNEWQSVRALNVRVTNLIGTGIVPRPDTSDEARKARITALWNTFVEVADADGVCDYYGMQSLGVRAYDEAGEFFIRARPRRAGSTFGTAVQFQLLESEMVPLFDADTWPGMPQGNRIRSGVEFNRMGQRVAYWMYREHPGDAATFDQSNLLRITAEFVKHVFKPLRIGQIRGVPAEAPTMAKLRTVTDFEDTTLARQHTANLFTGFVKKNTPTPDGVDSVTGRTVEYDMDGAPLASLEPGTMQELLPGEDVVFADPPDAGSNYGEFMRWQMMGISAGRNVPYELLTGDLKDVSDRALRIILNEFHRACEQEQWQVIIPGLCKWVYAQWLKFSYLAGDLSRRDISVPVIWSPDAWKYVHPVQDLQAKQLEKDLGLKSRSQLISEMGDDPQQVDAERAADKEREEALGLVVPPPDPAADPVKQAEAKAVEARARLLDAERDSLVAKQAQMANESDARIAHLRAQAAREQAEHSLALAQQESAEADRDAARARMLHESAAAAAREADAAAAAARADAESAARIAALEDQARHAKELAAKNLAAAEIAANRADELREVVLSTERERARTAQLEREAAERVLGEMT